MHTRNHFGQLNGEYQRLTEVAGFQDLRMADRSVAIMRHDVAGLTLYAEAKQKSGKSPLPRRRKFILAFESEVTDGKQIELVIVRTYDARIVWRVLRLINQHAHHIQHQISHSAHAQCKCDDQPCWATILGPVNVRSIGEFDRAETREAIGKSLSALTNSHEEDCYDGFVSAVCSVVDAWLASQSLWAPAVPCANMSKSTASRTNA